MLDSFRSGWQPYSARQCDWHAPSMQAGWLVGTIIANLAGHVEDSGCMSRLFSLLWHLVLVSGDAAGSAFSAICRELAAAASNPSGASGSVERRTLFLAWAASHDLPPTMRILAALLACQTCAMGDARCPCTSASGLQRFSAVLGSIFLCIRPAEAQPLIRELYEQIRACMQWRRCACTRALFSGLPGGARIPVETLPEKGLLSAAVEQVFAAARTRPPHPLADLAVGETCAHHSAGRQRVAVVARLRLPAAGTMSNSDVLPPTQAARMSRFSSDGYALSIARVAVQEQPAMCPALTPPPAHKLVIGVHFQAPSDRSVLLSAVTQVGIAAPCLPGMCALTECLESWLRMADAECMPFTSRTVVVAPILGRPLTTEWLPAGLGCGQMIPVQQDIWAPWLGGVELPFGVREYLSWPGSRPWLLPPPYPHAWPLRRVCSTPVTTMQPRMVLPVRPPEGVRAQVPVANPDGAAVLDVNIDLRSAPAAALEAPVGPSPQVQPAAPPRHRHGLAATEGLAPHLLRRWTSSTANSDAVLQVPTPQSTSSEPPSGSEHVKKLMVQPSGMWDFAPAFLVLGGSASAPGTVVSVAAGASAPLALCSGPLHGPAQLGYSLLENEEIVVFALVEVTCQE
jgi:hypothetical protein